MQTISHASSDASTADQASGPWFEVCSLGRVIAIWFAVFVLASLIGSSSRNDWLEMFPIAVNCVGLVMAASWTVLYGELRWQRLLKYVGLVVGVVCVGAGLCGELDNASEIILVTVLAAVFGIVPFYLARKFFGWRILHARSLSEAMDFDSQYSIAQIMSWTTFFAVLIVIANLAAKKLFRDNVSQFLFFMLLALLVPAVVTLIFCALAGRLRAPTLTIVVPFVALIVATAMTVFLTLVDGGFRSPIRYVFWPNLVWFSFAGWCLTVAIWFLRRRGFVFAFGVSSSSVPQEELRRIQVRTLEKQLESTQAWRGRLAWIDERLKSRLRRLKAELADYTSDDGGPEV